MKRLSILLVWVVVFFIGLNVFGQDQTYNTCNGLIQIKASDGSLGYKWDAAPGLLSPNSQATYVSGLATNTTTTYTVRSKVTDGNSLVINGDFELGNVGFTSSYIYYTQGTLTGQLEQGLYSVTAKGERANKYNIGFGNFGDHSGTGRMLIADGACGTNGVPPQATVWAQTIAVEPNTDYIFSAWMTNVALNGISSSLRFSINDAVIGSPTSTLNTVGTWGQFYVTWNSGSATTAKIAIAEQTGVCGGNDFAIDDISFNKVKEIVETIKVIVGPPTETPVITGANSLCSSGTVDLKGSIAGGTWTSSNTVVATIDATGKITAKTPGITNISYTIGGACGSKTSLPFEVTVTTSAISPVITGSHSVCLSNSINLTGSVAGGIWTSSNLSVATIDASGKVTAVSSGKTNVTYSISGSCGSAISNPFEVTVSPAPIIPVITGDNFLCSLSTVNLSSSVNGGTWTSSNTAVATIDASGKVTAVSFGKTDITYSSITICGNVISLPFEVTVNGTPATPVITGDNSLCLSSTINLSSSVNGGTWASSNTAVATIDALGKVTAVSAGKTNITYSNSTICGNVISLPFEVTVNGTPATPLITGDNSLCLSNNINLTSSTTGGAWVSSTPTVATIDASGKITALSSGKTNITYALNSACGSVTSLPFEVTVNSLPQLNEIIGVSKLNMGDQSPLTINLPGGIWISSNASVVEIAVDGTVKGLKSGESEITYTLITPCGTLVSLPFKVTVLNDDLYVPNAFTPNGDGNNDEFRIYGSSIDKIDFAIFNQWGELVYKTTDLSQGWIGTYKGAEQPAGVYIYTAKLKMIDGQEMIKKGSVNLIR